MLEPSQGLKDRADWNPAAVVVSIMSAKAYCDDPTPLGSFGCTRSSYTPSPVCCSLNSAPPCSLVISAYAVFAQTPLVGMHSPRWRRSVHVAGVARLPKLTLYS